MRRATAEPLEPQDLETEGERQLRALLQNQLDTRASLQGCVSKRARFAPGVVYQPFGERAAGTLTLYQFRDLQEREGERDALRELGLSDPEIQLWRDPKSAGKAAPDAVCRRLAALQEKVAERRRVLALPQRFAGSKRLNRRQMEIERALFQGTDRHGFLRALYHQGEEGSLAPTLPAGTEEGNLAHMLPTGTEEWSPIHTVAIGEETLAQTLPLNTNEGSLAQTLSASMEKRRLAQVVPATTERSLAQAPAGTEEGRLAETPTGIKDGSLAQTLSALEKRSRVLPYQEERLCLTLPAGRTLASLGSGGRVGSVREAVVSVSEEEILQNRASLEEIRSLARCRDYRAGEPSAVLRVSNLSPRVSLGDLVALFSRFQPTPPTPPIQYRILTGRLRGQAFITLHDTQLARSALQLLLGFRLQGRPLVIEFARRPPEAEGRPSIPQPCETPISHGHVAQSSPGSHLTHS